MKLYYHHVGQEGSKDFDKTVFSDINISILNNIEDEDIRNAARTNIARLFPTGRFNCWGVPPGAKPVIRNLAVGDYVLLIQEARVTGVIPALCHVKFYLPSEQPALSQALWGNNDYPYIFFFDTEHLDLSWVDFIDQVNYKPNYNPRGQFLSVADEKLAAFGGVEGYVTYIRSNFSKEPALFAPMTLSELQSEQQHLDPDENEPVKLDKDTIAAELSKICNISLKEGDDPALIQETKTNTHTVKERNAAFGIAVKRLYCFRCAVCNAGAKGPNGETEVESAHFYPKSRNGSDNVRNGICLCRKHHWAFDVGLFAISDDYTVIVREDIPEETDYDFIRVWAHKKIHLPQNEELKPHLNFVRAHRNMMNFFE